MTCSLSTVLATTTFLAALVVGLVPESANADLIGDSVHATSRFPNFATVVDDGGTKTIAAGTFSLCRSRV